MGGTRGWLLGLAMACAAVVGCDRGSGTPQMPTVAVVDSAYGATVSPEISGNLLRVRVPMPEGFERGGSLWARSGPYFYLFSTATRDLLFAYPDIAAVEVVAVTDEGEEVASARLLRNTLNEITWDRAIAIAALAQTEGTERPAHVDELVRYAEDITEHEYNPEFVPE